MPHLMLRKVKSCDEALLEMSHYSSVEEVLKAVADLRHEILTETGCACSAGIANNVRHIIEFSLQV